MELEGTLGARCPVFCLLSGRHKSFQGLALSFFFFFFFLKYSTEGDPDISLGNSFRFLSPWLSRNSVLCSATDLFHLNFIQWRKALKEFQGGLDQQLKPLSSPAPKRDWESPTRTCRTRLCAPGKGLTAAPHASGCQEGKTVCLTFRNPSHGQRSLVGYCPGGS